MSFLFPFFSQFQRGARESPQETRAQSPVLLGFDHIERVKQRLQFRFAIKWVGIGSFCRGRHNGSKLQHRFGISSLSLSLRDTNCTSFHELRSEGENSCNWWPIRMIIRVYLCLSVVGNSAACLVSTLQRAVFRHAKAGSPYPAGLVTAMLINNDCIPK